MIADANDLVEKAFTFGMIQVPEEITALVELLKQHEPRNVMEIGSEAGGTFYLWCRLAEYDGLKISVDLPSGSSGSGRFQEATALAARSAQFKRWSGNVHVVTGDSHAQQTWQEVKNILGGEKLDFLFIDGDHSAEGVRLDWEDYSRFVRKGGFIDFHDIKDTEHHRRRGGFVHEFWRELQGAKIEFSANRHWGGIGVVTA